MKIGGRWYSTRAAVRRFFQKQVEQLTAPALETMDIKDRAASGYLESIGLGRKREGGDQ